MSPLHTSAPILKICDHDHRFQTGSEWLQSLRRRSRFYERCAKKHCVHVGDVVDFSHIKHTVDFCALSHDACRHRRLSRTLVWKMRLGLYHQEVSAAA